MAQHSAPKKPAHKPAYNPNPGPSQSPTTPDQASQARSPVQQGAPSPSAGFGALGGAGSGQTNNPTWDQSVAQMSPQQQATLVNAFNQTFGTNFKTLTDLQGNPKALGIINSSTITTQVKLKGVLQSAAPNQFGTTVPNPIAPTLNSGAGFAQADHPPAGGPIPQSFSLDATQSATLDKAAPQYQQYMPQIMSAAHAFNVPWQVILGVLMTENGSADPNAENHNADGSVDAGLAQINSKNPPAGVDPSQAADPNYAITALAQTLASYGKAFNGNWGLAAVAWHAPADASYAFQHGGFYPAGKAADDTSYAKKALGFLAN